jgi:diguanylate cyclase (GGDEF)-like protein
LDGFKSINDVLGHVGGDELLLKVVSRVKSVIRDADVIARVGGDEFMVLINYLGQNNDAGKMAAKINRALLPAFEFNGNQYYLTASIGVALYPNDSEDAQKLMQYADFAMRLAKKRGKNHYQYYQSDLNVEAERVMRISNDLRVAIASNQLELYFHPQICSVSGKLTGLEALLRWKHPELGMIPPALFIPIAEELGFIVNIGQWVLNRACECCIIWKAQGLVGFTISVNLSIKELQREEFVDDIAECVYGYQIEPSMLQFEITESIFAYDTEMIIHKLHQLKKIGFQIAMDDFGTGYSCLSYLKDLPIDVIKIDRSFVQALSFAHNERHKAIIASIIDLAQRLHITTLAEGVETEEQADYLRSLGCEHLQGFLIAKPMPFDKTTEFLSEKLQKTHWLPAAQKGGKDQN